jgi:hypothetical protein
MKEPFVSPRSRNRSCLCRTYKSAGSRSSILRNRRKPVDVAFGARAATTGARRLALTTSKGRNTIRSHLIEMLQTSVVLLCDQFFDLSSRQFESVLNNRPVSARQLQTAVEELTFRSPAQIRIAVSLTVHPSPGGLSAVSERFKFGVHESLASPST